MATHSPSMSSQNDQNNQIHPSSPLSIAFPPTSAAQDTTFISTIATLVNKVYDEVERDIFIPGYQRTTPAEISSLIQKGQLAVAHLSSSNSPIVVGCVSVKRPSPTKGQFGMLALDSAHRGGGLGRTIVEFAQDHCRREGCTVMQLELLVPTTFTHAFKERMQAWYLRLGYEIVHLGSFMDDYPELAPLLAGPTDYRVFEKSLARVG